MHAPPPHRIGPPDGPAGTTLCRLPDPGPATDPVPLPAGAAQLVRSIRTGSAPGILPPPVVPGPDNTLMRDGELHGERDARVIAHALADSRFAPVRDLLARLDRWCRATAPRFPVLAPGVLTITNAGLFGPLISECFVTCAAGPAERARGLAEQRAGQCEAFLELFLTRLDRDLTGRSWPRADPLRGPVTALRAHDEETHNGGQRVLRLDLAGGGRVAYKPRPASGETLFLSPETSLFALLNRLPPGSGQVRLPVLPTWTGSHPDPESCPGFTGYSWQEWLEPPAPRGVLRAEGDWRMTGTVLEPPRAARFWHAAGSLSAACFAFGVVDLHGGNILVGARGGDDEPLLYPVDLEAYFAGVTRLSDTGLVEHPAAAGNNHHVGLENEARWCSLEGPPACWWRTLDGGLELRWRAAPFGRVQTRSVVADSSGRSGYGPYLPAMLRGMFDLWTLVGRHRSTVLAFLDAHRARHTVRVIPRQTSSYDSALRYRQDLADRFGPAEVAQLARGDVPYFFRAASGGPLLSTPPPPGPFAATEVDVHSEGEAAWPPQPAVTGGEALTLTGLGVALADAVAHVFHDLPELEAHDAAYGVRLHARAPDDGQASFEWPEQHRRITYRWTGGKVRVRVDELSAPVPAPPPPAVDGEIRRRLLRLDHLDNALRGRWTASGFTDPALEEKLHRLTDTGLTWLRAVIAQHGWPGRALVGAAAAAAACRLVQHGNGQLAFRKHCLELVRQATEAGDVPARDLAGLTDALRLAEGRPQWYGTKFEPIGDTLQPYPIEAPDEVDDRRAAVGLEPLAQYADRIRATFPLRPGQPRNGPEAPAR